MLVDTAGAGGIALPASTRISARAETCSWTQFMRECRSSAVRAQLLYSVDTYSRYSVDTTAIVSSCGA